MLLPAGSASDGPPALEPPQDSLQVTGMQHTTHTTVQMAHEEDLVVPLGSTSHTPENPIYDVVVIGAGAAGIGAGVALQRAGTLVFS